MSLKFAQIEDEKRILPLGNKLIYRCYGYIKASSIGTEDCTKPIL
jgi:hypothetical protein